jgi:hypothetical protein
VPRRQHDERQHHRPWQQHAVSRRTRSLLGERRKPGLSEHASPTTRYMRSDEFVRPSCRTVGRRAWSEPSELLRRRGSLSWAAGTTHDMLRKRSRKRDVYLWIAGVCVVVFIVVMVVALLLDATGAIGGKRLASHPAKERQAVPVPVPTRAAPAVRVSTPPIALHSTTASTSAVHASPAVSLPQGRQAPGATHAPGAPLPPPTGPRVTTPGTSPSAPLLRVPAPVHSSAPTESPAAPVQVLAGTTPALPGVLGVLTAPVDLHLRIG